ncbi:YjgN family protein [Pararhizobium sp.]|uniref:YjgN family protein n=1 Tax=Pararhizobium sp. TaxID=1977563 RepID=UPI00271CEC89|nr:YjgN family protein [Pararhizobium sp.]MDO9418306.1 YjgN family protein [Pararhizobium sp.]
MSVEFGKAGVASAQQFERGVFTGKATEYFGIWLVNVLLTIITFGIYSAWAKVRRNRYFFGNTMLLGRAFEYHATGKQIFLGRVIVFIFFIALQVIAVISPVMAFVPPILVLAALPWLVKRGLRFSARVTSYRNVRFDFVGGTGGAFVAFVLGSIISFLSLGILAPLASRWTYKYVFNNLRYGDRPFSSDPKLGALYGQWIVPFLMVVIGAVILGLIGLSMTGFISTIFSEFDGTDTNTTLALIGLIYAAFFGVLIVYGLAGLIYRAGVRNVAWSSGLLDGKHELKSDLSRLRYAWIVLSNMVITILTLGFMRPWAAVRQARYVTSHTAIRFVGDVGEVLSSFEASGAAVSAEFMDMEGIDFGF